MTEAESKRDTLLVLVAAAVLAFGSLWLVRGRHEGAAYGLLCAPEGTEWHEGSQDGRHRVR